MGQKTEKGQITVFISLVMLCIFALFCVLLESARTAGARWYLQTASSSALDSIFSQYHRQLWDSYRLLFAEYENAAELEADFSQFLQPYLETGNWYPLGLQAIEVEELQTAIDGDGAYLEQEILDYMSFGIWKMDFDENSVERLWEDAQEAEAVQEVAEAYRGHAKKALELEKTLEAIDKVQKKQIEKKQECLSLLKRHDGPKFRQCAKELIQELARMPGLIAQYRQQADKLAKELEQGRSLFDEKRNDCTSQVDGQMDDEIRQFEAYILQDGERRQEIEALGPQSRQQIALVEKVIEEAKEVERIIKEWEDDDEEDEGPDLNALWAPVIRHFNQLSVNPLSFSHGIKDKEKESWLNRITSLYSTGLLLFVMPEDMAVSQGLLETPELPSHNQMAAGETRTAPLPEHLMLNEYCGKFFRYFPANKEGFQDQGVPGESGLSYEIEYIISGKDRDEENLTHVVNRLLAIREGLNLIHILSDSQKRHAAEELAALITGIAGLSPLVLLTTFFIMSVWAMGESLMDVRNLLAGKRVAIVKNAADWSLGLENLLTLGREGQMDTKGGGRGLTYLSWLKILLLMETIVRQEYRMMDMIQMNLCRKQPSFRMRRGTYQVRMTGRFNGKHVFFSLKFVENLLGNGDNFYPMSVKVERTY